MGGLMDTTTVATEFMESSEGATTSEETTDVIGTTTLDLCSLFEFGCCADNETEASGPDRQGCPCSATEYGCCPDGVSPGKKLFIFCQIPVLNLCDIKIYTKFSFRPSRRMPRTLSYIATWLLPG